MKSNVAPAQPVLTAYDEDFVAWTEQTASLLRSGQLGAVDIVHLAEEIEDMGKRERKELHSRLVVLLTHLLKWELQPEKRSRSWGSTLITQRLKIAYLLGQSPSLRRRIVTELEEAYAGAVKIAAVQTGLGKSVFAARCPYSPKQILDDEFLPEK